jgi:hypothetical protein
MPQLVKGGKYVFGWSMVKSHGEIRIPDEAYSEYELNKDVNAILLSGSKTSGGFGLSSKRILRNTVLGKYLDAYSELLDFKIPEGKIINIKNRTYSWVKLLDTKSIILPELCLNNYEIKIDDKLLVGRGSRLAIAFIAKGPIYEEAQKHPKILYF